MGSEGGAAEHGGGGVGGHREPVEAVVADQGQVVGRAELGGTPTGRGRPLVTGHGASLHAGISLSSRDPNQVISDNVAHPTLSIQETTQYQNQNVWSSYCVAYKCVSRLLMWFKASWVD